MCFESKIICILWNKICPSIAVSVESSRVESSLVSLYIYPAISNEHCTQCAVYTARSSCLHLISVYRANITECDINGGKQLWLHLFFLFSLFLRFSFLFIHCHVFFWRSFFSLPLLLLLLWFSVIIIIFFGNCARVSHCLSMAVVSVYVCVCLSSIHLMCHISIYRIW